MKRAFVLALVTSLACIGVGLLFRPKERLPLETEPFAMEQRTTESSDNAAETLDGALLLRVLRDDGTVEQMSLRQYLPGVLLGEMPASFEPEAKLAQAVVSRTYALHRRRSGKHPEANVCVNASCCQAWVDPDTCSPEAVEAAKAAVEETDGLVLVYDGRLIDATFFSCSGGRTEDAVAVWGSDVPYLQAVDSAGENAPYDEDTAVFSPEEFSALIREEAPEAILSGGCQNWFGNVTYTEGGGVDQIEIGGVSFTGKTLRGLLGLRSTAFTVETQPGQILFHTRGYGHRVGMSQYGAQAMAQAGNSFEEILNHYYTGVSLNYYIDVIE